MPLTLAEKIIAAHAGANSLVPGQMVVTSTTGKSTLGNQSTPMRV